MKLFQAMCLFMICSVALAETNPSLASVLTPDGRIIGGVSGSFDPSGFRITNGPGGEPLFISDEPSAGEPMPPSDEQSAEGQWDNRFGVLPGVSDYVSAVAVSGSDVYVGGDFGGAGGIPVGFIARWDGSSWHALGSGLFGSVFTIAVSGSSVYAGGSFTYAGGDIVNRIACWDGSSWKALGSGLNGNVNTISVSGSTVFVGGWFTRAGGLPASYMACWVESPVGTEPPTGEVVPGETQPLFASPNPISTDVNLYFNSIGLSPLTLNVYDTAGRLVMTQALGVIPAGLHTHYWDGRDGSGSPLASGVYFVRLSSTELQASTRVMLIR